MPQPFTLSRHAAIGLAERGIDIAWVIASLDNPTWHETDAQDPDLRHALRRINAFGGRVLRVVYNPRETPWRVVTVFFDRKASRSLP